MTMMQNSLHPLPVLNIHRNVASPAQDTIATVLKKAALNCTGFEALRAQVKFTGGTTPDVTIQPYYVGEKEDGSEEWFLLGSTFGPLSDTEGFDLTVDGGRVFLAISAINGAPTNLIIRVGGRSRARQ